ncbi:BrnA antitoxin family protein [Methylobacterium durans]|uniref:BrnA antitoxin family protein n=1 Tax=Methylobacterium durans TaxID=2202825 RepID=A0A2U8WET7_9HYPH|nr:BrnA antitoxin family protein [Methylobacterium durans]AWN43920.1 hypothetical protein DK389_29675 [Methylobacterium durans]
MPKPEHAPGYVPNPGYTQDDWDAVSDNPALIDDELAAARPGPDGMPPGVAAAFVSRIGRPKAERRKVPVTIRLDPDVVAAFKATGPGWQTRMNDALRAAVRDLSAA